MKDLSLVLVFLMMISCGVKEENEQLHQAVDSLESELRISKQAISILDQVGALMDSIDRSRNMLYLDLETGTSYENYTERMNEISMYVEESEKKIKGLEQELNRAGRKNNIYLANIKRLKKEIEEKNKEIQDLETLLAEVKIENTDLITNLRLKQSQLDEREMQIMAKNQELQFLEKRIEELALKAKITQGDALFAKGEAWEVAANRTQLARRKKQSALQHALESYKKAAELGHEEAKQKVQALSEELD